MKRDDELMCWRVDKIPWSYSNLHTADAFNILIYIRKQVINGVYILCHLLAKSIIVGRIRWS